MVKSHALVYSILCWNVMGRSPQKGRASKISRKILDLQSDIICLQEVSSTKFIKKINISEKYFVIKSKNFSTTNASIILSKFPVIRSGEVLLDNLKNYRGDHGCVWADLLVNNDILRVYTCHLKIRKVGVIERSAEIKRILKHVRNFKGQTIICGDMNTIMPKRGLRRLVIMRNHSIKKRSMYINGKYYKGNEVHHFNSIIKKYGFKDALDIHKTTWAVPHTSFEWGNFKLDWLLIKRFKPKSYKLLPYCSSDHRPIIVKF